MEGSALRAQQAATFEEEDLQSRALLHDLHAIQPRVYWTDLLLSAGIGWVAFGFAAFLPFSAAQMICVCIAVVALYRALCFIHEISHPKQRALPGFETVWNLLAGFPMLMPSFIYVGVHQSHHNPRTYGTSQDPEYLPFASSQRMTILFALESFLAPAALMLRFLAAAPLGFAHSAVSKDGSWQYTLPHLRSTLRTGGKSPTRCRYKSAGTA